MSQENKEQQPYQENENQDQEQDWQDENDQSLNQNQNHPAGPTGPEGVEQNQPQPEGFMAYEQNGEGNQYQGQQGQEQEGEDGEQGGQGQQVQQEQKNEEQGLQGQVAVPSNASPNSPPIVPPEQQLVALAVTMRQSGYQCQQVKNYQGALPMYLMASDISPSNGSYLLDIGRVFYMMGQQENAMGFFMKAVDKGIQGNIRALAFNFMGNILQTRAEYENSIVSYTQSIKSDATYAGYYYNRGISHKMLGDYENAVKDFTSTVSLKNDYANAYQNRAFIYYIAKMFKKSISDFTICLMIDDQNPQYWSKRGSALDDFGKSQKALLDFDKAIELRGSADDYYNRGITYSRLNQHEEGIVDFTKAIEKSKKKFYFENRARSYDALGMSDKAKEDRDFAATLLNQVPESQDSIEA